MFFIGLLILIVIVIEGFFLNGVAKASGSYQASKGVEHKLRYGPGKELLGNPTHQNDEHEDGDHAFA
jgi:hypothetical protein